MIATHDHSTRSTVQPIMCGLLVGAIQAASPVAFRWLEPATLHALYIAFIAAVYIGFAVADGRTRVIAVESSIAAAFLALAAAGVTGSAWLLVAGYAAHGLKDLWQHRTRFVAGTRWWPPFCAAVDFLVAAILAVGVLYGMSFH
jgi:ribonuclease PH